MSSPRFIRVSAIAAAPLLHVTATTRVTPCAWLICFTPSFLRHQWLFVAMRGRRFAIARKRVSQRTANPDVLCKDAQRRECSFRDAALSAALPIWKR